MSHTWAPLRRSRIKTMISVTATVDIKKLRGFSSHADRLLKGVAKEGLEVGERYMTSVVPHGSGRLASAVGTSGPTEVAPGHYVGSVGVNSVIAPHAEQVDRGTGIDGPSMMPVTINRPPRTIRPGARGFGQSTRMGAMRFQKNGEPVRFRQVVKSHPSVKIQRNRNFSGRTHDAMRDWARIRTGVLAGQLSLYFVDKSDL